MGLVTSGIPQQITLELAQLSGATAFVETGTFQGATTRWASQHFAQVHTIERAVQLYSEYGPSLAKLRGVKPHLGDSRTILPQVVKQLGATPAVFWLDGHYSGGETAGAGDECPLMDELACLSNRPHDIILIDDARLFLCAPPLPHDPAQWPGLANIITALCTGSVARMVQVVDDVIFSVPQHTPASQCLVAYAQARANDCWEQFAKLHRGPSSKIRALTKLISKR